MIMFDKTKPEQITVSKVLENVDEFIKFGGSYPIRQIYNELSIFDWWPNNLNQNHLKQMRSFLKLAIKLGYDGYCCFKVGASGCANGMWAYKARSTTGYSPMVLAFIGRLHQIILIIHFAMKMVNGPKKSWKTWA